MLRQVLGDEEMVVATGYIYLPLLFDPAIDQEIQASLPVAGPQGNSGNSGAPAVIHHSQRYFVKSLNLWSLLENYPKLQPESYKRLESHCFNKYVLRTEAVVALLTGKLKTIIFEILPHFIKTTRGLRKIRPGKQDILGFLSDRLPIPASYQEYARKILDPERLTRNLADLEKSLTPVEPPPEGLISGRSLRQWFYQALFGKILELKKARLRDALRRVEDLIRMKTAYLPLLLYLAETGSLEIDGFGFSRIGSRDEYLIYKRTGEYALKDYYGRLYLFPDCRVAASTLGTLRPIVLEKYKHPFLLQYRSGQSICLRHFHPPQVFTAQHAITALEEGINALFHGYDYRRRNGYHSLDHLPKSEGKITFDDYRIPSTHPKFLSGKIEVKNDFR